MSTEMTTGNMSPEEIDATIDSALTHASKEALNPDSPVVEEEKAAVEDLAARDYMVLLPMFEKKIEDLSNRQLKKVFITLMRYPFEMAEVPFWSYPQEKELFDIAMKISDAKFVLTRTILEMKKDQIEDLMRQSVEPKLEEFK